MEKQKLQTFSTSPQISSSFSSLTNNSVSVHYSSSVLVDFLRSIKNILSDSKMVKRREAFFKCVNSMFY
jgi:hypothetical protein